VIEIEKRLPEDYEKIINKEGSIWKNFLFTYLYLFYLGLHLA
jgi:hypothetical protein